MKNILSSIRLTTKVILLGVVLILSFLILSEGFILPFIGSSLENEAIRKTKNLVESALSITQHYYNLYKEGKLTEEEAKETVKSTLKSIRYGDQDYFWINDYTPTMVMHPIKSELDGQDLSNYADPTGFKLFVAMVDVVRQKGEGTVKYQWPKAGKDEPQPKISYVKGFEPWKWIIGTGIYVDDLVAIRSSIANRIRLIIFGFVLLGAVIILSITLPLNKSLRKVLDYIERISNYDFSELLDMNQSDEIGKIANGINTMVKEIRGLVKNVADVMSSVSTLNSQVLEAINQTSLAIQQISTTSQGVASGAQETAKNVTSASTEVENISKNIEELAQNASNVEKSSLDTVKLTNDGRVVIEELNKGFSQTTQATDSVVRVMNELELAAGEIGRIVETISSISSQTNLLALNAAIEAARAGDAGRGFAVVADEVRKLAEESNQSAQKISQFVNEIKAQINKAAQSTDEAVKTISKQVDIGSKVTETFNAIAQANNRAMEMVQSIVSGINNLLESGRRISDAVQGVAAIAEENAASAEETSAATEEVNASIEEINANIQQLSDLIKELRGHIEKFRV
ncbi:MAG: methyl-accepting chemotaxis protein [bacterium]|nr:methyl-accepting chemotaxis protein [bacterium]